ncbi:MAG: hypothetical protein WC358_08370 [Ignavibacteria bacterium]
MQINDNIKTLLLSILKNGVDSDCIDEFVYLCKSISFSYLKTNKYSKEILGKEKITVDELSLDIVAELFAVKDGMYFSIKNYFDKIQIEKLQNEEIMAMLVVLVRSRGQQRISEIREEQGEIYYKIKKSFDSYLHRNRDDIDVKIFRDKEYIFAKGIKVFDFSIPMMPEDELLNELFARDFKNFMIPEVSRFIIEIVCTQNQFCQALEKTYFINILSQFYKRRLKDEIYYKNADYFKYE